MSKFLQTTNRTIAWFKKANDNGELEMKPPFQRNPVWNHPQKSYLIDSILNGYPVPELYMQEFIDESGNEKHVIIDGQQRIRSCLEYIEGQFELNSDDSPSWANMKFEDLSGQDKKKIYSYTFIVRILPEMPDEEIRGIFQRLNKNVVALNPQELRQATYWGPFIKTMQTLSDYNYWSTSGVFTPQNIRRMIDVEYISELSIAVLHGHQNKKQTLDKYYLEYEDSFDYADDLINTFQRTLVEIEQIFPDIKNTRWRKKTDFYTLFVYLASKNNYFPLSTEDRANVRNILDQFSAQVDEFVSTNEGDKDFDSDVEKYGKAIRASSDLNNRKKREEALKSKLNSVFQKETAIPKIEPSTQSQLFENESEEDSQ